MPRVSLVLTLAVAVVGEATTPVLAPRLPIKTVPNEASFLVMGDWGGQSDFPWVTEGQVGSAYAMGLVAQSLDSQFVLGLGDNFYSTGIATNDTDPRFAETWASVYTAPSLQTPFYFIAGNHDYHGNVSAEVEFSNIDPTKRWTFPNPYYSFKIESQHKRWTAEFVMIDTVLLTGNSDFNSDGSLRSEEESFQHPSGPEDVKVAQDQLQWLSQTLRNSTATYTFVCGHYSVFSAASHGSDPILQLEVLPLLRAHGVTAYLSGHDHTAQFLQDNDVAYIQQGMAHDCCYNNTNVDLLPEGALKFGMFNKNGTGDPALSGFSSITCSEERCSVSYYDNMAKEVFQTTLEPRK